MDEYWRRVILRATGLGTVITSLALAANASAATLEVTPDAAGLDQLRYAAASGEVNSFTVDPWRRSEDSSSVFVSFAEASAPLQLGAGCTQDPPRCSAAPFYLPVLVHLGDLDDRARVVPFYSHSYVWGEQGDDDITSNGNDGYAWGGQGDDRVHVGAGYLAAAWGGGGDDVISGGNGAAIIDLHGDTGNDLLVPAGGLIVTAEGGLGADTIVQLGYAQGQRTKDVDAGAGDDVVIVPGGRVRGGPGADLLRGGEGVDTIGADNGFDVIDVAGDPGTVDTVACGGGRDIVRADPDDQIASDCEQRLDTTSPLAASAEQALADAQRRAEDALPLHARS